MRRTERFDNGWLFHEEIEPAKPPKNRGYGYVSAKTQRLKFGPGAYKHNDMPDSWDFDNELFAEKWEDVTLPHDYIIGQTPDKNENAAFGFFHYHNAWYRKHFTIPQSERGQRITILFEGVTGHATVYLNGCLLKYNHCGFTPFEVDITDYVAYDQDNVLAVYVDVSLPETWWYYGGGIYRHVYLNFTDTVAVDLYGAFVHPEKVGENTWSVPVTTTVRNDSYEDVSVEITHRILAPNGEVFAAFSAGGSAPLRKCTDIEAQTTVTAPLLWDVDAPHLYRLETLVHKNGVLCDRHETRFGFRTIRFDADHGFFLNERHVKIKGVCSHQDFGLTGKAVPDNIYRYRIAMLKEMGANGYRTAHYPHDPATMDALDEMGFLVAAETRHFESSEESLRQAEITVKRDRNRPSVICWITGNEEMEYHNIEQGIRIQHAMSAKIKQIDPTRLVSTAVGFPEQSVVLDDVDFLGLNYRFKELENLRNAHPDRAVVSTENCASSSSMGTYFGNVASDGRFDARDMDRFPDNWYFGREGTWKFIMDKEWLCGGYQWVAFDYRGESDCWPRQCNASGSIDLFLRKKDVFFQNQSHWTDTPMVHVLPHWNHQGLEGMLINVWAYTNCTELELFLNGQSFGRKQIERFGHGEWDVPYTRGELTVIGYINGKEAARETHTTTGQPVALRLETETPTAVSDGTEAALIKCYCVDEHNRYVPNAAPIVTFETDDSGTVVATGSSSSDTTSVIAAKRQMFLGEIRALIKPAPNAETVTVFAYAPGLETAMLQIPFISGAAPKCEEKKKEVRRAGDLAES